LGPFGSPNYAVPVPYVDFLEVEDGALASYPSRRSASSLHEPLSRSPWLRSCSRRGRSRIARASPCAARLATKCRHVPGCRDFRIACR
jgi:hypothetical protein